MSSDEFPDWKPQQGVSYSIRPHYHGMSPFGNRVSYNYIYPQGSSLEYTHYPQSQWTAEVNTKLPVSPLYGPSQREIKKMKKEKKKNKQALDFLLSQKK